MGLGVDAPIAKPPLRCGGKLGSGSPRTQSHTRHFMAAPPPESRFRRSGIRDLKPPFDALEPVAEAIETNRLLGKKDVQTRDIAFQSTQLTGSL